jgi:hypothetical protein
MEQNPMQHIMSSTAITCDECGHDIFENKIYLRRISKLLMATDKDQIIPMPTMVCAACEHVNEEFVPKFPTEKPKTIIT